MGYNEKTLRESADLHIDELSYNDAGLMPAIVQDASTKEVLMLAWMNAESLELTLRSRKATFFSRSRNKLWMKGEESGNVQEVLEVRYDCDADTLLVLVKPAGPACHTGEESCFYRTLKLMSKNDVAKEDE